ncbi:glycosyltransferase family 2 protein [uncultured Roseobacter sp.]|uniref:glycosyltransferase family 2 protein n=1 Tax=uncultured Roseobacter sp. TaxID=114847 RepID=UPI002634EF4C|nr:glycosyltransferase family 2 protein [uncultured Roseobacter sp.]
MDVQRHEIATLQTGAGTVFGVVAPVDGAQTSMVFTDVGFPRDALDSNAGFDIRAVRRIGNALQIIGKSPAPDNGVVLPLTGEEMQVISLKPQPELFDDLNTCVAIRHAETAENVRDWLVFHAGQHDLEALLLIDRAADPETSALETLLNARPVPGIRRVLILRFDTPLGVPGEGDARLPWYAPDAPGRDRMQHPLPDQENAPYGAVILYEMTRYLYLGKAAGVMNLDVSDLLLPLKGDTVFDAAARSPRGVLLLKGERIYPWGLRPGGTTGFGDHICRRFDAEGGASRWCVAPDRVSGAAIWRQVRIVGATDDDTPQMPFVQAMALRHPGVQVSGIAPKSSLSEDKELIALFAGHFGETPRRAPRVSLKPRPGADANRTGIVTCMKNEGPFILEWLAWHRSIGVTDFIVYSNDCTDGTDSFLSLLEEKGLVRHRDNPFRQMGMKPQHAALHAADQEPLFADLDWVVSMDVDEFINIHVGEGKLTDLYAAVGDANLISMTWRLFGNAGVEKFEDQFVTEQFARCAAQFTRKPHQAWGFKTLVRNIGIFRKMGVHRPKGLQPQLVDEIRWVNGSGAALPRSEYRNAWRSTTATWGYDLVTLNHYALRSADSFLVKRDRGRVNHVDRDQGLNYWFRMNHNAQEDHSAQRLVPGARAEFDRLMQDAEIAAAHNQCVEAHCAHIRALKKTQKYQQFYSEITGQRLQKLSLMLRAFGSAVFAQGPDCIPDHVLDEAGNPDFFFTVEAEASLEEET